MTGNRNTPEPGDALRALLLRTATATTQVIAAATDETMDSVDRAVERFIKELSLQPGQADDYHFILDQLVIRLQELQERADLACRTALAVETLHQGIVDHLKIQILGNACQPLEGQTLAFRVVAGPTDVAYDEEALGQHGQEYQRPTRGMAYDLERMKKDLEAGKVIPGVVLRHTYELVSEVIKRPKQNDQGA
jgi:hypothetical protein